jgi:hypothetical protein
MAPFRPTISRSQFLILPALILLAFTLGALPFPCQGQTDQDAERTRTLELANQAIAEAEKLVPDPSPIHTYYPESSKEERHKAKKMVATMDGLRKADMALSEFLTKHPDDVALLWTQVHLDFLKRQLPVEIAGREARKSDFITSAGRDPMKTLDHILELDPNDPNAYIRRAQLFAEPELRGLSIPSDLAAAAESARKAVELSPDDAYYRETQAGILLQMGRDREAKEVLQPLDGGHHPVYLLLLDWSTLPLPPQAVLDEDGTQLGAQVMALTGKSYPGLRTRSYRLAQNVAELETFYRGYWEDFRFSQKEVEITKGEYRRTFLAHFQWENDKWRLVDPVYPIPPNETGLIFTVYEHRIKAKTGDAVPPVGCTLTIDDFRPVSSAKP